MSNYTRQFTLSQLFESGVLKDKLPMLTANKPRKSAKIAHDALDTLVGNVALSGAKTAMYKATLTGAGSYMTIQGRPMTTLDDAVDAVFRTVLSNRQTFKLALSQTTIISTAMVEAQRRKRWGKETALYLRVNSAKEIEGMSTRRLTAFYNNILENIYFSDDFRDTQKKLGLTRSFSPAEYAHAKELWERRVGYK